MSATPIPKSRLGLAWLSILVSSLAVPVQRLSGRFPTQEFMHTDIFFLPTLFTDVSRAGTLGDWDLPGANYLLFDWPLYWLAWSVTPTVDGAGAAFAMLQFLAFALVWFLFARTFSPYAALATALGMVALTPFILMGHYPADLMAVSFVRFGTVIATVAALWLIRTERSGALFTLTALATVSDQIFVVWLVVPALLISLIVSRLPLGVQRSPKPLERALVLGTLIGLALRTAMVRSSGAYSIGPDFDFPFSTRLGLLVRSVTDPIWEGQWFIAVVLFSIVVILNTAFKRKDPGMVWFTIWIVVAGMTTAAAEIAVTGTTVPHWRYHQFLYILPVMAAATAVAAWMHDEARANPKLLPLLNRPELALLGVASLIVGITFLTEPALGWNQNEDRISCLDSALQESGSRRGFGNYAAAREAVVRSELELEVGERNTQLLPETDVHSSRWYDGPADFAIRFPTIFGSLPSPSLTALAEREPSVTICGRWEILDFGPGGIDPDRLKTTGETATLRAGDLATTTVAGGVQFGGASFPVEPGLYEVELTSAGLLSSPLIGVHLWTRGEATPERTEFASGGETTFGIRVSRLAQGESLEPVVTLQEDQAALLTSISVTRISD